MIERSIHHRLDGLLMPLLALGFRHILHEVVVGVGARVPAIVRPGSVERLVAPAEPGQKATLELGEIVAGLRAVR